MWFVTSLLCPSFTSLVLYRRAQKFVYCPCDQFISWMSKTLMCFQNVGGPLLVHCSAGVGRTGALIVIDMIINEIDKKGLSHDIDIFRAVQTVRRQRGGMVQTDSQYQFIYKAVHQFVQEKMNSKEEVYFEVSWLVCYIHVLCICSLIVCFFLKRQAQQWHYCTKHCKVSNHPSSSPHHWHSRVIVACWVGKVTLF